MSKFQSRVILSAIFMLLLLHQHAINAENLARRDNVDVEVDAAAHLTVDEESARRLQTLTVGTLIPVGVTQKPGMTNMDVTVAFRAAGLSGAGKVVHITAPTLYNITDSCMTTQAVPTSGQSATVDTKEYTVKGVASTFISECAADSDNISKAVVTISENAVPDTPEAELLALTIKYQTSPPEGPNDVVDNRWMVAVGSNSVTINTGFEFLDVKGWVNLKQPAGAIGTPATAGPSIRPTTLEGDKLVPVGLYFSFTSQITAGKGFILKIPTDLQLGKTGSCKDADIDMKVYLCQTAECEESLKVGDIESDAIKESTDDFGCVAATNNVKILAKAAIPTSKGVYLGFKLKTPELTESKNVGHIEIWGCTDATCAVPANHAAYLTDMKLQDYGSTIGNIHVQKKANAMWATPLFLLILSVLI